MSYYSSLQNSLDLLFYKDRSRDRISSKDREVLSLFSGDESAARAALRSFHQRHPDATEIIEANGSLVVKSYGLFPDPEQNVQRDNYRERQRWRKRQ